MFKFLHAADLHLDSPLKGLERFDDAPKEAIRGATRRALENLVQLALDEEVDFVLIAGDVYDRDWDDHNAGLFFLRQMDRLRQAEIHVYWIAGNHDAANKMTKELKPLENMHRLDHKRPQTVEVERCDGVVVHGQSFATQAVTERLVQGYPPARSGAFNIGLLHTSPDGSEGHDPYAPCSRDELETKGYAYWALGHIHKRGPVWNKPAIMFPGNLQGRNIRETGPKGCLIVAVDDRDQPTTRFQPLDVLRWEVCDVPAGDLETPDDVLGLFARRLTEHVQAADGRPLAVRVDVSGASRAHEYLLGDQEKWASEIRAAAMTVGGDQVWIEKIKFGTTPPIDWELPSDGPLGEVVELLAELKRDPGLLEELAAELAPLASKLAAELVDGDDRLNLADAACLRNLLGQVQPLLVNRLAAGGAGK